MLMLSNGKYIKTDLQPNQIMNWEEDASGNIIYAGYAARGTPDGSPGWFIEEYTIGGASAVSKVRKSAENQIWDNRATVEYL